MLLTRINSKIISSSFTLIMRRIVFYAYLETLAHLYCNYIWYLSLIRIIAINDSYTHIRITN
jgi:hypothetical protein